MPKYQAQEGNTHFQEELLPFTFDLLLHLLIEMLDFFIISRDFPRGDRRRS